MIILKGYVREEYGSRYLRMHEVNFWKAAFKKYEVITSNVLKAVFHKFYLGRS